MDALKSMTAPSKKRAGKGEWCLKEMQGIIAGTCSEDLLELLVEIGIVYCVMVVLSLKTHAGIRKL